MCKKTCHEGECDKCKMIIDEKCVCGLCTREIECWELYDKNHKKYICDEICNKKLSCKVHNCNKVCCPARTGPDPEGVHLCLKVCGKMLNCGIHTCELFCHIGLC